MHEEKNSKQKDKDAIPTGAVPAYLLDREGVSRAKVLSNSVKQKRKEKAGKWAVPVPKVRPMAEAEMFRVVKSGKRQKKAWKRMITKATFVGEGFTRKPPKVSIFFPNYWLLIDLLSHSHLLVVACLLSTRGLFARLA